MVFERGHVLATARLDSLCRRVDSELPESTIGKCQCECLGDGLRGGYWPDHRGRKRGVDAQGEERRDPESARGASGEGSQDREESGAES